MEYFDLFSDQNLPLWQRKLRPDVHREGDWHRSVEVWIFNENQELLLNLRHPDKDLFANYWDVCIAGHLIPGENYRTAAIREVQEELSATVVASDLQFMGVWKMDGFDTETQSYDREFAGVFVWKTTLPVEAFQPQIDEISELAFVPLETVRNDLQHPGTGLRFIPLESIFLEILAYIESTDVLNP